MKTPEIGTLEPVLTARLVPEGEDGSEKEPQSRQSFTLQGSLYFSLPVKLRLSRLTSPTDP